MPIDRPPSTRQLLSSRALHVQRWYERGDRQQQSAILVSYLRYQPANRLRVQQNMLVLYARVRAGAAYRFAL